MFYCYVTLKVCFWLQKISMRTLKINLIHLIQTTNLYENLKMCNLSLKKLNSLGISLVLLGGSQGETRRPPRKTRGCTVII